jgi:acetyl esterase/lipase
MRLLVLSIVIACVLPAAAAEKIVRIMPVGDSITEGGSSFSNWRYPLWEKLYSAGYLVEYVGSRKSPSRIGDLFHEGYGGKNSAFLAANVPANFKKTPADIVLLHAGHNHFAEEKPVPGIVRDTEAMIAAFRAVNPKVIVLLAQPITSSKLPKYSYIPELHLALAELTERLTKPSSPVIIVPQGDGFDPVKEAIADGVHPNESGARKMADQWFKALVKVLGNPLPLQQPEMVTYKKTHKGTLMLHVFKPSKPSTAPRPAIVFFFGGGWKIGTPLQFYPECRHFANRGIVAISADYRTAFTHGTSAFEADADGKSAIRWIRAHAKELGIDPNKIIAAGASAGGQIAAACGTVPGLDEPSEDRSVSSRPNALMLWYPVIDNGPQGYGDVAVKARHQEISPLHHITKNAPPTILFLGTKDSLVPVATARDYQAKMKQSGVRCELKLFEGAGHPIYEYRKGQSPLRDQILRDADAFIDGLWK